MSSSSSGSDSEREEAPQQRQRTISSSSSAPSHRSASPAREATPQAGGDSGSERSHASPERPQRRLVESSSDEEENSQQAAKHNDVFGDDLSDSDNEDGDVGKAPPPDDDGDDKSNAGSEGSVHGIRLYNEQEDEQFDENLPPQVITSDAPRLNFNLGDELYHVRMPNFLSLESKPFDPQEYEDNDEDDPILDAEGQERLKLKVENTIRWRQIPGEDGEEPRHESNAKIVKWSDGTMSLYLGNEIFELSDSRLLAHTHLYVRQAHGLAGKAVFEKRLKFRPCSTDSKTHKKVTMNMADRTKKSGQVRFIQEIGENPDEAKKETVRREEEALRAAYRRERETNLRRRERERGRGMSSGFLEDRGDYSDEESPTRARYGKREAPIIGASESEDSDEGRRLEKSKEETSDSDEEFRKNRQQQKKKIVTSDEESD